MSPRRFAALLLRLVLGAIFLYAAVSKLIDPGKFAQEIANYRVLPAHLVPAAAAAMPSCEVVIGVLLVTGVLVADAALAATLLLIVFSAAVASSLWRGIDLVCGCFGGQELVSGWTLARDLLLTAGSGLLVALSHGQAQSPSGQAGQGHAAAAPPAV
jgi:uncharacterized membrane protein YphA (DoxX/SURF4 family)